MKYVPLILGALLAGCASPYKTPEDVIAKTCSVIADKFDNRCAENIMVKYVDFEGRFFGYTLGSNAVVIDARCKDVDWRHASNCVNLLAHEVAHASGLKYEHEVDFVARRVWDIGN